MSSDKTKTKMCKLNSIPVPLQTCADVCVWFLSTRSAYHYKKYSVWLGTYGVWRDGEGGGRRASFDKQDSGVSFRCSENGDTFHLTNRSCTAVYTRLPSRVHTHTKTSQTDATDRFFHLNFENVKKISLYATVVSSKYQTLQEAKVLKLFWL